MVLILFRILIGFAILFFIYSAYQYFVNPLRKLEAAKRNKTFYFLDDEYNVKKNFLCAYKGALFEGEKYLGATKHSFDVVTISVWAKDPNLLKGITKDDILNLEKKIMKRYPHARIEWRQPIKNLL